MTNCRDRRTLSCRPGIADDAIGHGWSRNRQDELFSTISQRASDRLPSTSRQMTAPWGATPSA
jgi:hypothetical protein